MKHLLFLIIILVVCVVCIGSKPQEKALTPLLNPFNNKEWLSELEKDTGEMKAAWLKAFDPFSFSSEAYNGLNVFLDGEDPSNMVSVIRQHLMSYINAYCFFENPEKAWKELIEEQKARIMEKDLNNQNLLFPNWEGAYFRKIKKNRAESP